MFKKAHRWCDSFLPSNPQVNTVLTAFREAQPSTRGWSVHKKGPTFLSITKTFRPLCRAVRLLESQLPTSPRALALHLLHHSHTVCDPCGGAVEGGTVCKEHYRHTRVLLWNTAGALTPPQVPIVLLQIQMGLSSASRGFLKNIF